MSYQNLILEEAGAIARLTINRPEKLNALNRATLAEIVSALGAIGRNRSVRVVILTGAGEKAFIAGADIAELANLTPLAAQEFAREGQLACTMISRLDKPVIAAVNGFALGGGCEIALACHIRIGSRKAKLGQPEVNLGVIPGWGGTQRLPRLVGLGLALEMILTGDPIPADEAHRIGLLNRVVEPEELLPTCEAIAGKIAARGPVAVKLALDACHRGLEGSLAEGLALEADAFGLAASTADWREGTAAFLERRPAAFQGE